MTDHILDRPVWRALTTRQATLARGDARALRLEPDHGPFAAAADASSESLAALVELIPSDGHLRVVETEELVPPDAVVVRTAVLHQMVAAMVEPASPAFEIVPLSDDDAPEMRMLATLTEPGPFHASTHRLGGFVGVKEKGSLIAMAGERMKPSCFTEVSGVCTHPAHRGRGYANALMRTVAQHILARGEMPFLHVLASNTSAIALYETLGFRFRREMVMTVLARA